MISTPWYTQYEALRGRLSDLKVQFTNRCRSLDVDPNVAVSEIWEDIVIRAVHESNWQEGVYVERGKTRELAVHVFDDLGGVTGPHLDFAGILDTHKAHVVGLKRRGVSADELAAYNLSAAHLAVTWIGADLARRQSASLACALREFRDLIESRGAPLPGDKRAAQAIQRGFDLLEELASSPAEIHAPITGGVQTEGLMLQHFLNMDFEELIKPMRDDYLHFLHRLLLMGTADPRRCGKYRTTQVNVGNPDLLFPPPSAVPKLMAEFCRKFPTILPTTVKYDPIRKAAEVSHRFVRIHPYHDGNGRVSRLLMNLVLWGHHPPVYLKADAKGRHRYGQALRRADRGNPEPLACLIATSLVEVYAKMLDAVTEGATGP
jgi:fido (protein-threonine AMPylation protein)